MRSGRGALQARGRASEQTRRENLAHNENHTEGQHSEGTVYEGGCHGR